MEKANKQVRNISVDILRIILALMVVTIHIGAPATGHVLESISWMPSKMFAYIAHYLSIPAVNIYILISGYFSYKCEFNYMSIFKKAISLWMVLFFYSLLGLITSFLIYGLQINILDIKNHVFFLSTGEWWFMSCYFCLLFFGPLLNTIITSFSEKQFYIFVLMASVICCISPSLCAWKDPIGLNYGYSLIWFIVLYIIGGSIKRFALDKKYNFGFVRYIKYYLLMTLLILCQNFLFCKIFELPDSAFSHYNSLTIFLQALFLFLAFLNLKISIPLNKFIILLSSLSMSVYILHCQSDFAKIIWSFTKPSSYADEVILPIIYITISFGIFVFACTIEFFRVKFFSLLKINRILSMITNNGGRIIEKFDRFI